jgi:hypothetical protein
MAWFMRRREASQSRSRSAAGPRNGPGGAWTSAAGPFARRLGEYLAQLAELRQRNASEDSIRDAFLRWLRGAFPNLEAAETILPEKHVPALRVRGGYADVLYDDLIFEFKRRLDEASRAQGYAELQRHLGNQQHVRKLALQYQLLEARQAHLITQMELATLFFAYAAEHFVSGGGTIAFVMPRSVLTGAKQHEPFRERYVYGARRIVDCEGVSPLFNVPACVIV